MVTSSGGNVINVWIEDGSPKPMILVGKAGLQRERGDCSDIHTYTYNDNVCYYDDVISN